VQCLRPLRRQSESVSRLIKSASVLRPPGLIEAIWFLSEFESAMKTRCHPIGLWVNVRALEGRKEAVVGSWLRRSRRLTTLRTTPMKRHGRVAYVFFSRMGRF
jgi:hypothetical protein